MKDNISVRFILLIVLSTAMTLTGWLCFELVDLTAVKVIGVIGAIVFGLADFILLLFTAFIYKNEPPQRGIDKNGKAKAGISVFAKFLIVAFLTCTVFAVAGLVVFLNSPMEALQVIGAIVGIVFGVLDLTVLLLAYFVYG